jgi:hypothetical protein
VILSARESNSRSGCCDIVRSGGKRCGLGKVRHFGGVRHSVVSDVKFNVYGAACCIQRERNKNYSERLQVEHI